jgi:tRNA pseudouridine55 synthase
MDSEGAVLSTGNSDNVTREDLEKVLDRFRGDIMQTPPMYVAHRCIPGQMLMVLFRFSALKMDGKPLYEYAREGKPLPRAIPSRKCNVSIELIDYKPASKSPGDGGHTYTWPSKRLDGEEKATFKKLTDLVHQASKAEKDAVEPALPDVEAVEVPEVSEKTGERPATFRVRMTVTSGTYVRSIVHDIGLALGCGAHVVELTRTRQGEFVLQGDEEIIAEKEAEAKRGAMDEEEALANGQSLPGPSTGAIPWPVFEKAIKARDETLAAEAKGKADAIAEGRSAEEIDMEFGRDAIWKKRRTGELAEWENELLRRFVGVPIPVTGSHDHTRHSGPSYR